MKRTGSAPGAKYSNMDEIIEKLRDKDEKAAYEFAKKIGIESAESDKYVEKIPVFSEMLTDKI